MQPDELAEIFRRYGYFVQRRCTLLLGNSADAEDVTQEVFMRVQRYSSSLTAPVTLAWLYAIAARCCFDRAQQRQRQTPVAHASLEALAGSSAAPPERALVGQLLRSMDRKTSEIAILHHVEGWTQEEIAAHTGYSRKTIGKKLSLFSQTFKDAWQRLSALRREVGS